MIIPKSEQVTSEVNGHHTIDGKKTKRRAPSPPVDDGNSSITTPTGLPQPTAELEDKSDKVEHKSPFPVFIAPPPPDSIPPPIDECETPVGPIDSEFGEK